MNTARRPCTLVGSPVNPGSFVKALFLGPDLDSENEPGGASAQTVPQERCSSTIESYRAFRRTQEIDTQTLLEVLAEPSAQRQLDLRLQNNLVFAVALELYAANSM
jgi:hypothetical protein